MNGLPRHRPIGARLERRVSPEWLDELPADDPRAIRSRRDLRLVNRLMWTHSLLLRALDSAASRSPMRLVELGAGDGTTMLRLARSRSRQWPDAKVALLDLRSVVGADTLARIRDLGWSVDVLQGDAVEWLARSPSCEGCIMLANLFVHHFDGERLVRLLHGIATRSRMFVCCEPRRSAASLAGSRLLGLIGCNDVTRHDAVISVHAGFRDEELSSLWRERCPGGSLEWTLEERAAGWFSHLFVARRSKVLVGPSHEPA